MPRPLRITEMKATPQHARIHNAHLILKTIYDRSSISRADVARITGLTRPTVSAAVVELIEMGLVTEIGYGPSGGGKPPILLNVLDNARCLVGIDLAETEFRGGLLDLRGNLLHRVTLPLNGANGDAALALVYSLVEQLLAAAQTPVLGVGIGAPGLVDAPNGTVRRSVNLEWRDLPLRALLQERHALPIYVANDSQVAALGEYTFGGHASPNMVVLKVGVGLGAGLVINGHLYYGDGSCAGEIGHVQVVMDGIACRCGHSGCLETVASGQAILRRAHEVLRDNPQHPLSQWGSAETLDWEALLAALADGEPTVLDIVAEAGRYLGVAAAYLVGALNVEHIVVAGSAARLGEALVGPLRAEMRCRSMTQLSAETQVNVSGLGQDIVIQGAAALLLANELDLI